MKIRIEIDGVETSVVLQSISIQKQLAGRSSTASFNLVVGVSELGSSDLPAQESEVIIYNDATNTKVFRGFVTTNSVDQKSGALQLWKISCIGLEYLLENVTVNRTWTGKTDRQIIQEAFTSALPEISTNSDTVSELSVAIDFTAKDISLRQLMEQLSIVSGADWRVTEEKALSYHASGSVVAQFSFSDNPS